MTATKPLSERSEEALRSAELLAACWEAGQLLEVGVRRLLEREVEVPLRPVAEKLRPLLVMQLHQRAREGAGLPPRRLERELADWTEARLRSLFGGMAAGTRELLAEGVEELERDYEARVEQMLTDLDQGHALPAELIRERLRAVPRREPSAPRLGFEPPRRLPRPPYLPGAPGRWLVRRAAEARLAAMVRTIAARLRSELGQGAAEAASAYRRDLRAAIEATLAEGRRR
jgi:hypothetical protein